MKEFLFDYVYYFVSTWLVTGFIGLWINLQTQKYIQIRDCLWALVFGPIYMVVNISDLDSIVIDLRKKD